MDGTLLVNEPGGLDECVLSIERDEELKGIFLKYTTDLWFYGDGWDYLLQKKEESRSCAQVACTIYYSCANDQPYEILFEGTIPLGEDYVNWDYYYCIVSTKIENADFSNLIQRYQDYRIRLNNSGTNYCIDGTTVLANLDFYSTQFFNNLNNGIYNELDISTVLVADALQYALSFLSNNKITLDMDALYTTPFVAQELDITMPPVQVGVPNTLSVTFTNYYNQQYEVLINVVGVGGGVPTSSVRALARSICHIAPTGTAPTNRDNYFEKANWTDEATLSGQTIHVKNYLPWKTYAITNVTTAAPGTVTETATFQYGLTDLALTSGTHLTGQENYIYVTLGLLMRHLINFQNVGFRMVSTGGGNYTLQLRTQENLFNASPTVTLEHVPNIQAQTSGVYNVSSITTPTGNADNIFTKITFITGVCFGDKIQAEGQKFSSQEFVETFSFTARQTEDIYFVTLANRNGVAFTADAAKFETIIYDGAAGVQEKWHYNIQYIHGLIQARYLVNAGMNDTTGEIPQAVNDSAANSSCTNCPVAVINNNSTTQIDSLYKFAYPLRFDQVQNIIQNATDFITFTDAGRSFGRNGYVKRIEIPFGSFIGDFELFAD